MERLLSKAALFGVASWPLLPPPPPPPPPGY